MSDKKIRNMAEFAIACGISRPTISKYFNDPDSIKPSSRAKIEEALGRYDYRPNIYAVNQNRQMTKNIGIVVPYLADPFFAEMVRFIERLFIDTGYSPSLFSSHGEQKLEMEILDSLRAMKPAGVLLAPLGRISNHKAIEAFCSNVPTVLFDSNLEGIGEAFIGSDNHSFISQTVEYLTRTGEPPCFLEMKHPANPNANKRREAYLSIMHDLDFEPHVVSLDGTGWGFEEIGHQGGIKLLQEKSLPTRTVLCSNDRLAIGFLAACYERGVRVGRDESDDLRVASLDDHPFSRFTCPSLTTAAQDYMSVSKHAVETLFRLIECGGRFEQREEKLFPAKLILRESA
ncbi:LacI family DNA-binding transcriptional regulator [Leucothrix pacifica]|uniref:LacI family transcriptional regulator n=1 Tax=Leucothrix pacifica TaxID=1247513 RepID=A0A317CK75_9GAMM|nr:LacI family DNA-binding transcriptional regulator [Leucothrix pacifica]PWQ96732.1 LacI family transcriptional regulator [Leucothrix pacifica]